MRTLFKVLFLTLVCGLLTAHTTTTTISRSNLAHPDLGYDGGAGLHTTMETLYNKLGDNANSRFQQYTAVADSTVSSYVHNFGVAFTEVRVYIYTGSGDNLVRVDNPTGNGWGIAANGVAPKTTIDVTTPSSGGPHTFVFVAIHGDISLTDDVTGVLRVSDGGTGSTTSATAADALGVGATDATEFASTKLSGLAGAGFLELKDQSSEPSSPAGTDDLKVFVEDKVVYTKDSNGVVVPLGSGSGAGEVNYILNPDAAVDLTGWSASGAGVTVTRTTTASELPREPLTDTAIKITLVSGTTDYAKYCFQIGDSDKNKALKIQAAKLVSSYADGDAVAEIYSNDTADCAGSYTQENIMGYDDDIADINASNDVMFFTWLSTDSDWYELRVRRTAGTGFLALSNVVVGPGQIVKAPDPRFPSYDETEVTLIGNTGTWNTDAATFQVRSSSDGRYFLDFWYHATHTTTQSATITITGVTFKNGYGAKGQPFLMNTDSSTIYTTRAECTDNTATMVFYWSGTTGSHSGSGTCELESKPTWADKAAPDNYLAGLPDQAALDGNTKQDVDVDLVLAGGSAITQGYTVQATSYTRKGDSVRLMGRVQSTGTTANTGGIYFKFPDFVGDTVKLNNLAKYGSVHYSGTTNESGSLFYSSAENAFYVIVTNVNTVLESDFDTNYYMAFDIEFAVSGLNWFDYIYQYIVGFNTATFDGEPGLANEQVASGTYTPVASSLTNISATTVQDAQYMRVGNVVTVSGLISIDVVTSGVFSSLELSLPISSELTDDSELSGTAACHKEATDSGTAIRVRGEPTDDTAFFEGYPNFNSNELFGSGSCHSCH